MALVKTIEFFNIHGKQVKFPIPEHLNHLDHASWIGVNEWGVLSHSETQEDAIGIVRYSHE